MPELKRFLLGRRLASDETHQTKLNNFIGLSVFSSDALSSVAYATQEIMASLSMALPHGVAAVSLAGFVQPLFGMSVPVAFGIAGLLLILGIRPGACGIGGLSPVSMARNCAILSRNLAASSNSFPPS